MAMLSRGNHHFDNYNFHHHNINNYINYYDNHY